MLEKNFWYKSLRFILYTLLLTPLWVWSIFLFPFITSKILYFRILVELAFLIYLPLLIQYPEIRPRWNWLTRMVWVYLGVVFLASIFGVDFNTSFWGTVERGEGIITLLHFGVYFTILSSVFRKPEDWYRYLSAIVLIIAFTALYGLAQLTCYGSDVSNAASFCSRLLPTGGTRISATIGNASFYAAFLLFGIFLSLYLFYQSKNQKSQNINIPLGRVVGLSFLFTFLFILNEARSFSFGEILGSRNFWVYLIIVLPMIWFFSKFTRQFFFSMFLFGLIILFQTQTRGALLATAIAFFVYFLFNIFKSPQKKVKVVSLCLLILLVLSGIIIYTNREAAWIKANGTLNRLATISPSDITTQSRLDTWKASFKGWQDRIFAGYGYENYNIAFNKHFPARIFKDQGSQIWFDRAHDVIFDILVTSGIFGLIAYLGIFLAAGIILLRLYQASAKNFNWRFPIILAVLLLAYFLQNLFVFDTQATYLMIFAVLAYIVFLSSYSGSAHLDARQASGGRDRDLTEKKPVKGYPAGFFLPTALTVLIVITMYLVNFKPALANYYAIQGIKMAKLKQYREVEGLFKHSLSYGTYMDKEIRQRLVDYANEAVASGQLSPQEQTELYQYVVEQLRKSLKESPQDVKNYLYLMNIFNRFSPKPESINEVFLLGEESLKLSPTRPQIYYELGQAAFYKKDAEAGLNYFRKAIELNPEPKESHINYLLAGIVAGREDIVESQKKIITEDLGYKFTASDYINQARAYLMAGNKIKVAESYELALEQSPQSPELYAKAAVAYGDICAVEKARRYVLQAVQLNSSFAPEAQEFLRSIETKCKK